MPIVLMMQKYLLEKCNKWGVIACAIKKGAVIIKCIRIKLFVNFVCFSDFKQREQKEV